MTLVDRETGEILADISAEDARTLTDRIKVGVEAVWHLIAEAYQRRAWAALGHSSWDDYCTREFGTSRLRLPREERQEVVASLRESGLSIRAIATATGIGRRQVQEITSQVAPSDTPDRQAEVEPRFKASMKAPAPKVTGTDGKTYPAKPAAPAQPPRRAPLADAAQKAGWEFRKAVERLERIAADDRFAANKEQVAAHLEGHLSYAIEVCQDLIDQFTKES